MLYKGITLLFILKFIVAKELIKFKIYENTAIANKFKANFTIAPPLSVTQYNANISCLIACNMNNDCLLAQLDLILNICQMFNNQTSLMNSINKTDVVLFSKKELNICNDDFYADYVNSVCRKKKLSEVTCVSSEECSGRLGLECFNGKCQCANFPTKLLICLY
jgi:hypothetical protein